MNNIFNITENLSFCILAKAYEAINISAFANTNLEKITLPNKLSFIASYAFANIQNDKFSV
ncbi:leucine-rich repeat protein, partial [Mycoplasmopsis bovis]|uniref:leucine-rich repeat protein n=1 Tax=Mycoplasmopsis bovis TaxID=28903 RepID=UPI003D2E8D83